MFSFIDSISSLLFSSIQPDLSAEDTIVLLGLESCQPEKYSKLLKPTVLTQFGFSPPKVRVETLIPIFVVGAEDPTSKTLFSSSLVLPYLLSIFNDLLTLISHVPTRWL